MDLPLLGAGAVTKPKCNDLSLKLIYEVIKTAEKEPRIGICKLAKLISCDETHADFLNT